MTNLSETELREIEERLQFANNGYFESFGRHLLYHDIPALTATVRELQRQVAELEAVVQKVVKWNADYPSHRIYGEASIRRIAAEMDAINAEAIAALTKDKTP